MNRKHLSVSLAIVLGIVLVVDGCKAPTVDYQISQFATLRVMNFATTCGTSISSSGDVSPMDAYFFPANQSRSAVPNVLNLSYGQASVYSNLLPSTLDSIVVTPHLIQTVDLRTTLMLAPPSSANTGKYSFLITVDPNSGQFVHTLIQDGVMNPDTNFAYVRFINLQPNTGRLTMHVNNPATGDLIDTASYGTVSRYVPIRTKLDTSFAFIVTNSSNQIVTTLAYQTFTGANCYTLVYSGDLCGTLAANPGDSLVHLADTLRLRAFDDNSLGNDLTNPVLQTFRYNIINDIVPTLYPYDSSHPNANVVGFQINGAAFPEFYGFSIPPVPVYQGGGENFTGLASGAYDVNYQSAVVPNPLVVQGFATDNAGSFQKLLFTAGNTTAAPLSETNLLKPSNNNLPWSIMFYDTVPTPFQVDTGLLSHDLSNSSHYAIMQMPNISYADSVTLVLVAGIVPVKPNAGAPSNYTLFYIQPNSGNLVQGPLNAGGGQSTASSPKVIQLPLSPGTTENIVVADSIGNGKGSANTRVGGSTTNFTAQAGGIYEIVSMGTKVNPQILVMHVNP